MKCKNCGNTIRRDVNGYIHRDGFYTCIGLGSFGAAPLEFNDYLRLISN